MGRHKRIYYESSFYHVCARGNNRQFILGDDEAKKRFALIVSRYQQRMKFKLYAFVIMGNHFHMLMEVNERFGISKVMQGILLSYSIWYRRREKYVGHVWQGRFTSRVVMDERQMLENIRYIYENPVRARLVDRPEEYEWSLVGAYEKNSNTMAGIEVSRYGDSSDGT